MPRTTQMTEKGERWGRLWGARAADWAASEEQQLPTYDAAIRRIGIARGQRVLDIGCGAGVFLRAAADRGAEVWGIDSSEALLELAHERVPEADLRVGDMQFLPYENDRFDLVTGFNSFFFALDLVEALREAGRVAKPGAPIVIQVWGRYERCDLEAMKEIVRPFMPPPPPGARPQPELWMPGVLEEIAAAAGLRPGDAFDVSWVFEYADEDELGRGMLAPAGIAELVGPAREEAVRRQIVAALAPYRTADGGYRLANEYHYLIASA
jgi:SAM-dependent methyltransferase